MQADCRYLEDLLHHDIPLTRAMQLTVHSWADHQLRLAMPLAPNVNHTGTMFGGSLSAGPRPGGGFRVHLELPVPPVTVRPGAAPAYPDAAGVPNPGSTP